MVFPSAILKSIKQKKVCKLRQIQGADDNLNGEFKCDVTRRDKPSACYTKTSHSSVINSQPKPSEYDSKRSGSQALSADLSATDSSTAPNRQPLEDNKLPEKHRYLERHLFRNVSSGSEKAKSKKDKSKPFTSRKNPLITGKDSGEGLGVAAPGTPFDNGDDMEKCRPMNKPPGHNYNINDVEICNIPIDQRFQVGNDDRENDKTQIIAPTLSLSQVPSLMNNPRDGQTIRNFKGKNLCANLEDKQTNEISTIDGFKKFCRYPKDELPLCYTTGSGSTAKLDRDTKYYRSNKTKHKDIDLETDTSTLEENFKSRNIFYNTGTQSKGSIESDQYFESNLPKRSKNTNYSRKLNKSRNSSSPGKTFYGRETPARSHTPSVGLLGNQQHSQQNRVTISKSRSDCPPKRCEMTRLPTKVKLYETREILEHAVESLCYTAFIFFMTHLVLRFFRIYPSQQCILT